MLPSHLEIEDTDLMRVLTSALTTLSIGLVFVACGNDDPGSGLSCGPGTVASGNQCVPEGSGGSGTSGAGGAGASGVGASGGTSGGTAGSASGGAAGVGGAGGSSASGGSGGSGAGGSGGSAGVGGSGGSGASAGAGGSAGAAGSGGSGGGAGTGGSGGGANLHNWLTYRFNQKSYALDTTDIHEKSPRLIANFSAEVYWAPNGERFAFTRRVSSGPEGVQLINVDGRTLSSPSTVLPGRVIGWANDSRHLAIAVPEITIIDVTASPPVPRVAATAGTQAVWNPATTALAYVGDGGVNAYVVDVVSGVPSTPRLVASVDSDAFVNILKWTGDGTKVFVRQLKPGSLPGHATYAAFVASASATDASTMQSLPPGDPIVQANGPLLAQISSHMVTVFDVSGASPVTVFSTTITGSGGASPGGKYIHYRKSDGLYLYSFVTRTEHKLSATSADFKSVGFSADDAKWVGLAFDENGFLFSGSASGQQLFAAPTGTTSRVHISADGSIVGYYHEGNSSPATTQFLDVTGAPGGPFILPGGRFSPVFGAGQDRVALLTNAAQVNGLWRGDTLDLAERSGQTISAPQRAVGENGSLVLDVLWQP